MRRDGSHARRLTTNPFPGQGGDTDPNVSPDGRTVSFVRISVFDDQQALYSVRLDGSHLRRLLPYAADVAVKHDWSPDGKHIVVSLNANEGSRPHASANVAVLRPDGSHLRRLTHFKGREINALVGGYSPDGQWIVYRVETGDGEPTLPGGRYALMKVSPHGGEPVLVAAIDGRPRNIDWGPCPSSAGSLSGKTSTTSCRGRPRGPSPRYDATSVSAVGAPSRARVGVQQPHPVTRRRAGTWCGPR